jgi:magnesium-transporting ATPase (P-type)
MFVERDPATPNYIRPAELGQSESTVFNVLSFILMLPFAAFMIFYVGCLLYIPSYLAFLGLRYPVYGYPIYVSLGTIMACALCVMLISEWRDMKKNPWVAAVLLAASLALMVVTVFTNGLTSFGTLSFFAPAGRAPTALTKLREALRPPPPAVS